MNFEPKLDAERALCAVFEQQKRNYEQVYQSQLQWLAKMVEDSRRQLQELQSGSLFSPLLAN